MYKNQDRSKRIHKKKVPSELRLKVLEAARLTGTGLNTQHWRFILVDDKQHLEKLAEDRTKWKMGCRCQFFGNNTDKPKVQFSFD